MLHNNIIKGCRAAGSGRQRKGAFDMSDFVLFTDSTCDLTPELVAEMDVNVLPMNFMLDGKAYRNYPDNRELAPHDFYEALRQGGASTTSQVTMGEFTDAFTPVLEAGKDILYFGFSSGLSGTYQASRLVGSELSEKFPDRRIVCVDSLQASMGEGLFCYAVAMLRNSGASLDECVEFIEKETQHYCAWFTVDDLMFLKRGGRLSGAAAVAGTLLGIKPVLHVDEAGCLIPMAKVRGRRASLDALVKHFESDATDYAQQTVFISHGDCEEDAQYVADKIKAFGVKRVCINDIGPVIGAHSGPGTVALFYHGSHR